MGTNNKETKILPFIILLLSVVFIQVVMAIIIYRSFCSWTDRGTFGDMFGAINTLFSGLAFAGVVYAILLQRRELSLQRKELEYARKEYQRQAEALENTYSESIKMRSVQVFERVLEILKDLRPKWHELYKLPDDFKEWTEEQRALADQVGTELQQVAFYTLSGFIDTEYIMEGWAGVFRNCWNKLEKYIRQYRAECGEPLTLEEGAFQRRHFEKFSMMCIEHMSKFKKQ